MPSKDRQRALARAQLERRMARKAAAARRRRRVQAGVAAAVVLVALVAGTVFLVKKYGGSDGSSTKDSANPTCAYTDAARDKTTIKDAGKPSTGNVPHVGSHTAKLNTNFGAITVSLDEENAPCTVNSFLYLAKKGFYNNTQCHRITVTNDYILQCGDPFGTGKGGPSYQFGLENTPSANDHPPYPVGSVAMARDPNDPNSNGSQFFIVYKNSPDLTNDYSLFGEVSDGMDVITKKIAPNGITGENPPGSGDGKPAKPVTINKVTE